MTNRHFLNQTPPSVRLHRRLNRLDAAATLFICLFPWLFLLSAAGFFSPRIVAPFIAIWRALKLFLQF